MKIRWLMVFIAGLGLLMGNAESTEMLSLENLALPKTLGKVESRFTGESGRWVIHIQDVHAHLTAQENITAIIDHLHEIYGINTVAIEGGWDSTSFPLSQALPSSQAKQMLARGLLEEHIITGPAYSALFSSSPINLVGIEDQELYEKNRALYVEHLKHRDEILKRYEVLHEQLWDEKQNLYNKNLLIFDAHLMEFRSGKKAEKFIPALVTRGEAEGIDLSELPQIDLFRQALTIENSLKKEKLESEAKRLMEAYKNSRLHFEELLKSGKIPSERMQHYPEVVKYQQLMALQEKINHREFFDEIEEAIRRFKDKLFVSEEEKGLDKKSEALIYSGKIMLLGSTPDDLKKFELLRDFIAGEVNQAGLDKALELGLAFYELVKQRDEIFFQKIQSDPNLQGNIAVVAGGFHSEGLGALFTDAKVSHVVLTPDLGDHFEIDEKKYFQRLSEELPESQTLADSRNRFFTKRFDRALARAVEQLVLDKNITKAVQSVNLGRSYADPFDKVPPRASSIPGESLVPPSNASVFIQGLIDLPDSELAAKLSKGFVEAKSGSSPVALILEDAAIRALSSFDLQLVQALNKKDVTVLGYDYPDAPWTGIPHKSGLSLEGYLASSQNTAALLRRYKGKVAGIRAEGQEGLIGEIQQVIVFKPFIGAVLLAVDPELRNNLRNASAELQAHFAERLRLLFTSVEIQNQILRAA